MRFRGGVGGRVQGLGLRGQDLGLRDCVWGGT